jgi:hypothetical protein
MKKLISLFGIFILIFSQGVMAVNIDLSEKSINLLDNSYDNYIIGNDPPSWTNIEFNGTWGVSRGGKPDKELGKVEGYLETMERVGVIEAELPASQNEYVYYTKGIVVSYFILGLVVINNTKTFYFGFGNFNEDGTFYYNLHLFIGTSWYMEGTWREINNK